MSSSAMEPGVGEERRIVAGVDGSPGGAAALRWALGEAALRRAALHAVHAWAPPTPMDPGFGLATVAPEEGLREGAEATLAAALDEVAGQAGEVPVRGEVVHGDAAPALLEAARGADLLVVGASGHGALVGALLGSVSQHCVRHAPCPVVVVPAHGH